MEGELLAQRDRLCLVAADVFHDGLHVGRLGGGRGGKSGESGDQLHFRSPPARYAAPPPAGCIITSHP